ncbi:hypothetical protein HYV82_05095 [Candidatus Woesearchaeota archaeon]|nr:hypothetical protein [Candidatus Woesearchaeota archaeon]
MVSAVIFDCDGTIYDVKTVYMGEITGLRRAFKELGLRAYTQKIFQAGLHFGI